MTVAEAPSSRAPSRPRVAALLRQDITALRYAPGEGIDAKKVAHELGISRTPVRESLILLEEEGLVEVYPRVGTFVSLVDLKRIRDAQFLREAIETSSIADFRATPEVVDELRMILAQQEASVESQDSASFFELDEKFHRRLMDHAGHENAWKTVNAAKAHLDRARRLTMGRADDLADLVRQHRSIVDALEAGDGSAAVNRLTEHLRAIYDDIQVIRKEHPELFTDVASQQEAQRVTRRLQGGLLREGPEGL